MGKKKSVLSPRQKSPLLSHPGRGDRNFSQEGRFWLTKNRGAKQKKKESRERPHAAEDEREFPRKSRNDKSLKNFYFTSSIKFYALCLPGGKYLQNRYFKEQLSLTALVQNRPTVRKCAQSRHSMSAKHTRKHTVTLQSRPGAVPRVTQVSPNYSTVSFESFLESS